MNRYYFPVNRYYVLVEPLFIRIEPHEPSFPILYYYFFYRVLQTLEKVRGIAVLAVQDQSKNHFLAEDIEKLTD